MVKKIFSVIALFVFLGMSGSHVAYAKTFEVNDLLNLIANAKEKQVVLVNFYASWCPPCAEEVPHLINVRKKYSEEELIIVGINLDNTASAMEKFNKKMGINYQTYHDTGSMQNVYRVNSIPFNIIYGKNGNLIYAEPGFTDEERISKSIEYGMK